MSSLKSLSPLTVARVRSGVVTALCCAVTDLDSSFCEKIPSGKYALTLSGPGGIRRRMSFVEGRVSETSYGIGDAVLRFFSAEGMALTFGGGRGAVLPLPAGPRFPKAVKAFMTVSKRVGELSSRRDFADESEKRLVTEILMTAALRGVAETAMADSWTAAKSAAMMEGTVEVAVEGGGPSGWIRRCGDVWESGRGRAEAKANARLVFADLDTAYGLFTGTVAALKALGRGMVSIRGKVPMVQILFPLMDRFSEIMAWRAEGKADPKAAGGAGEKGSGSAESAGGATGETNPRAAKNPGEAAK